MQRQKADSLDDEIDEKQISTNIMAVAAGAIEMMPVATQK
jgi:hypothetical protein